MKIRSTLHLNAEETPVLLVPIQQETDEHLLLKLAASILFQPLHPIVTPSLQHPALQGQDFVPDLLQVNDQNEVTLWMECGKTTTHKLEKVCKRYREARIIMLTSQPREAKQMAAELGDASWNRVEYFCFAEGEFAKWAGSVREVNEIFGEASETEMNLVVNDAIYMTTLERR